MLTISAAPSSMASAQTVSDVIDSSRHTGVPIARASSAWPRRSSSGSGCSMSSRSKASSLARCSASWRGVGGVGVDLQGHIGSDQVADGGDRLEVEAGLDLQLDADVAVVEVAGDRGQQGVDGRVDADADAARDAVALDAEEVGERAVLGAQLGVEHGHLQRRLGHRVAADRLQDRGDVGRSQGGDVSQARRQHLADHEGRAVDVLRGVGRLVAGDALAPALRRHAVALDLGPHEQDPAAGLGSEAGLERGDERQTDLPQLAQSGGHDAPPAATR